MLRRLPALMIAALLALSAPAFADPLAPTISNPTSTLQLTSATTAYAAGNIIASSATAGSIVVPSFTIGAGSVQAAAIPRVRLSTNDAVSTSWGSASLQVDLWSAAPTFTNGDRAAFAVATGSASHLGAYTCTMSAMAGDGAYAECGPAVGSVALSRITAGSVIYWTLSAVGASGVTGASKVFTLTPEILN